MLAHDLEAPAPHQENVTTDFEPTVDNTDAVSPVFLSTGVTSDLAPAVDNTDAVADNDSNNATCSATISTRVNILEENKSAIGGAPTLDVSSMSQNDMVSNMIQSLLEDSSLADVMVPPVAAETNCLGLSLDAQVANALEDEVSAETAELVVDSGLSLDAQVANAFGEGEEVSAETAETVVDSGHLEALGEEIEAALGDCLSAEVLVVDAGESCMEPVQVEAMEEENPPENGGSDDVTVEESTSLSDEVDIFEAAADAAEDVAAVVDDVDDVLEAPNDNDDDFSEDADDATEASNDDLLISEKAEVGIAQIGADDPNEETTSGNCEEEGVDIAANQVETEQFVAPATALEPPGPDELDLEVGVTSTIILDDEASGEAIESVLEAATVSTTECLVVGPDTPVSDGNVELVSQDASLMEESLVSR